MTCFALLQHVIIEVDVGTKTVEKYASSESDFVQYAMNNVSIDDEYIDKS